MGALDSSLCCWRGTGRKQRQMECRDTVKKSKHLEKCVTSSQSGHMEPRCWCSQICGSSQGTLHSSPGHHLHSFGGLTQLRVWGKVAGHSSTERSQRVAQDRMCSAAGSQAGQDTHGRLAAGAWERTACPHRQSRNQASAQKGSAAFLGRRWQSFISQKVKTIFPLSSFRERLFFSSTENWAFGFDYRVHYRMIFMRVYLK